MPLEAKMLSRTVENAQKKVEEQNFLIRKRVLEYDDVMNEQRRVVYKYRREILEGRDMSDVAREEIGEVDRAAGRRVHAGRRARGLGHGRAGDPAAPDLAGRASTSAALAPRDVDREELARALNDDAMDAYERREQELGEELMRYLERSILLQVIDNRWREHLYDMDYLREGIHLRGFAQIDPLVAYKNEGFAMFEELMHSIWEEFSADHLPRRGRTSSRPAFEPEPEPGPQRARVLRRWARSSPRRCSRSPARRPGGPCRWPGVGSRSVGGRWGRPRPAAENRHGGQVRPRQDRPQRPLLVRLREEVQEVPRCIASAAPTPPAPSSGLQRRGPPALVAALDPEVEIQTSRGIVIGHDEARRWATRIPTGELHQRLVLDWIRDEGRHVIGGAKREWFWREDGKIADAQDLAIGGDDLRRRPDHTLAAVRGPRRGLAGGGRPRGGT